MTIAAKLELLKELKDLLAARFPENIEKVLLFGSQAMGTAEAFSDYDVLVVLKNEYDWHIKNAIFSICYELDLKYDILLDVKIISLAELATVRGRQPFILNAQEMGLSV